MEFEYLIAIFLGTISSLVFLLVLWKDKKRLMDPLYIILMVLALIVVIYTGLYSKEAAFQGALYLFFILNLVLLKISAPDYDIEKGVENTLRINGRCPKCAKKISSLAKKCPYCTSDL